MGLPKVRPTKDVALGTASLLIYFLYKWEAFWLEKLVRKYITCPAELPLKGPYYRQPVQGHFI
jgi:hypothetical protein